MKMSDLTVHCFKQNEDIFVLPSKEKIKCNWILVKTVEEITRYELQPYPVMFGGGENMWFHCSEGITEEKAWL